MSYSFLLLVPINLNNILISRYSTNTEVRQCPIESRLVNSETQASTLVNIVIHSLPTTSVGYMQQLFWVYYHCFIRKHFKISSARCAMRGSLYCLFAICLINGLFLAETKVYTRCGLTQELLKNGFSRTLVGNCE